MNIIGRKVIHRVFGMGEVCYVDKKQIVIAFEFGEKTFVYPDVFVSFLKAKDDRVAAYVYELIEKKEIQTSFEKERREQERKGKARLHKAFQNMARNMEYKREPRANIAIKYNFCDGGKSEKQVGFQGACTDENIRYNIEVEKRSWCSSAECLCSQYLKGKITRKELDRCVKREDKFICYESSVLRDWTAFAGTFQNGDKLGEPRKMLQIQKNNLCILTTREFHTREAERYIFALFLVDKVYEGGKYREGYAVAEKEQYRIALPREEARKLLFWNFHINQKDKDRPKWNTGFYRYLSNESAAQVLKEVVNIKKGTDEYQKALDMFEYFCQQNNVSMTSIGAPSGALKQVEEKN